MSEIEQTTPVTKADSLIDLNNNNTEQPAAVVVVVVAEAVVDANVVELAADLDKTLTISDTKEAASVVQPVEAEGDVEEPQTDSTDPDELIQQMNAATNSANDPGYAKCLIVFNNRFLYQNFFFLQN